MDKTILILAILVIPIMINAQNLYPGLSTEILVEGINPSSMATDHHGRVWVAEKNGEVHIINRDGFIYQDPAISLEVDDFNERGLLGIALHPELDNKPYIYLYYSVKNGSHNRLSRFQLNGDFVIPETEEVLMDFDQLSGGIHNGGGMVFDDKGCLYLGTGDGSQPANAQDLNSMLGKIIKIFLSIAG